MSKLDMQRRELRLRMDHAFGHSFMGHGTQGHHSMNIDSFFRELERFIDLKIKEALNDQKGL